MQKIHILSYFAMSIIILKVFINGEKNLNSYIKNRYFFYCKFIKMYHQAMTFVVMTMLVNFPI
jgi:hypothetical protein